MENVKTIEEPADILDALTDSMRKKFSELPIEQQIALRMNYQMTRKIVADERVKAEEKKHDGKRVDWGQLALWTLKQVVAQLESIGILEKRK